MRPAAAKANMASANREMPPSSSDEEDDGPATEPIVEAVEEEEKKEPEDDEEEDSDDAELERLYGMGRNKNNEVKVVAQAKQGREAVPDIDDPDLGNDSDDDDDEEESKQPAQSL